MYLDADDELEPQFLEVCLRVLENNPALAGVYTLNSFIDDKGAVCSWLLDGKPQQIDENTVETVKTYLKGVL